MKKSEIVSQILQERVHKPRHQSSTAFAPTNIALIKYWGKRDQELMLPTTNSLSITLPDWGATTTVSLSENNFDSLHLNDTQVKRNSSFYERTIAFLNLIRPEQNVYYDIKTILNIPFSAGLASSACGFAALTLAFNDLYRWQLSQTKLSLLSRLGSGSACRSLWPGFVEWQKGTRADGLDSHGMPLPYTWPELRIGLIILDESAKVHSSTQAMQHTVETSILYESWPKKVEHDLHQIIQAIEQKNFTLFGSVIESNALTMHATMLAAEPAVIYQQPQTWQAIHQIYKLRSDNIQVFFTEDAGPNIKIIFCEKDYETILKTFPDMQISVPFPE